MLALAMTIITNSNIRGALPQTICLTCLALMWLESALGLCLGCELYGLLVRRGWATRDAAFEVCAHGACEVVPRQGLQTARRTQKIEMPPWAPARGDPYADDSRDWRH